MDCMERGRLWQACGQQSTLQGLKIDKMAASHLTEFVQKCQHSSRLIQRKRRGFQSQAQQDL